MKVALVRKNKEIEQRAKPTWMESKRFLQRCDLNKIGRTVIVLHYKNYIENRPKSDVFPVGARKNYPVPALTGCDMEKALILAVHDDACVVCGKNGGSHSIHVTRLNNNKSILEFHHEEPLLLRGNNDIANIITVCPHCHEILDAEQEAKMPERLQKTISKYREVSEEITA